MATQLFFRNENASTHLGTNNSSLAGSASTWETRALSTSRGAAFNGETTATVDGPTAGIEVAGSITALLEFLSEPVSSDVTIAGAITGNIWASESNMSANVAINFVVDRVSAVDGSITQIVKSARTTEVAVTTRSVNNFTATPGAGVTLNRGDRIRVRIFADDAGTMNAGFTWTATWDGPTPGADSDSFVTFTETFNFESAPAGTTIYLTNTVSDVATAAVDREMWTSRGGGVQTDVCNTAAGWTAPIQMTDTAGGTVVEWYSKQLAAFTLGGMAEVHLRALESNGDANASLKAEIARVDSDGTNPVIWGSWCIAPLTTDDGELSTSEAERIARVSGDDLSVADGQRLRLRVYIDDMSSDPMVTGRTVTLFYAGTSGGASGDSFVVLPQTVSDQFAVRIPRSTPYPQLLAH